MNKKFRAIVAIVVGCIILSAFLFARRYSNLEYLAIPLWLIMFLCIFFVAYLFYKKEWRTILGLSKKDITAKVKWKAFRTGLFISMISLGIIFIPLVVFKLPFSDPFGGKISGLGILFGMFVLAPITEEIIFRGFIQGVLQKNFALDQNKFHIKIIIVITTFIFTIAHVRYILYAETVQWILSLFGIFIAGLYLGYLRNKYQSIVPSMFAHLGFNVAGFVMAPIVLVIFLVTQPEGFGKFQQMQNQMEFTNDSIYNFNPNNYDTLYESQRKFLAFHNPPHPELKQYIVKETTRRSWRTVSVWVYYDIDTCGKVCNARLEPLSTESETDTYNEIEKEAIRLVESFPRHKPFIKDGSRELWVCSVLVPIYY